MRDLLDKAGKTAKEVAGKAGETAGTLFETGKEKAGDLIETGKVKAKIRTLKNDMNTCYQKIGTYYYNKYAEGEAVDGIVGDWCREIQEIQGQIEALKENKD